MGSQEDEEKNAETQAEEARKTWLGRSFSRVSVCRRIQNIKPMIIPDRNIQKPQKRSPGKTGGSWYMKPGPVRVSPLVSRMRRHAPLVPVRTSPDERSFFVSSTSVSQMSTPETRIAIVPATARKSNGKPVLTSWFSMRLKPEKIRAPALYHGLKSPKRMRLPERKQMAHIRTRFDLIFTVSPLLKVNCSVFIFM